MNAMSRLLIAASALLLLAACSRVTPENYAKLEAGMSREAVYELLGQPDEISGGGVGKLTMSAESWRGARHRISVTFAGDTLALKSIDAVTKD